MASVRVENLSKCYRMAERPGGYRLLREAFLSALFALWRRSKTARERWALHDVDFSVEPGEVVGIIGPNGAGKSTLFKILSRITEPTSGRVLLRGRVGSLLEVGTGFHLELSGRDNIYLNGAILGMTRREIAQRFDEIVAFAELESFLDTPVKKYSSGMYMRLAFAVAASLEPDILLVDEVLAVGDVAFQRKCLQRMHEVGASGRTVLMVSHDLSAISRLCRRAVLLDAGRIVLDGPADEVVHAYLHSGLGLRAEREWADDAPGNEIVRVVRVRACNENGTTQTAFDIRHPVLLELEYDVLEPGHLLIPGYHLFNAQGVQLFAANDLDEEWRNRPRPRGRYVSRAEIPGNFLAEGTLTGGVSIATPRPFAVHLWERDAIAFQVIDSFAGDSARGDFAGPMPGVVRPLLRCQTQWRGQEERACA